MPHLALSSAEPANDYAGAIGSAPATSQSIRVIPLGPTIARGGLAYWQRKRAEALLTAALATDISIAALADECRLSPGYFIRAFRQSFGVTPYQWLSRARVERAMELLLEQHQSLADIAQACGFSDQSHLSRAFRQRVGDPPARWRRMRIA
jgi:AraC-like DNA-binding protein